MGHGPKDSSVESMSGTKHDGLPFASRPYQLVLRKGNGQVTLYHATLSDNMDQGATRPSFLSAIDPHSFDGQVRFNAFLFSETTLVSQLVYPATNPAIDLLQSARDSRRLLCYVQNGIVCY
jgi:hypothetical protein